MAYALLRAASALMPTLYHRHSCLCSGVSTFGGRVTQVGRLIACPLRLRLCCSVGQADSLPASPESRRLLSSLRTNKQGPLPKPGPASPTFDRSKA